MGPRLYFQQARVIPVQAAPTVEVHAKAVGAAAVVIGG